MSFDACKDAFRAAVEAATPEYRARDGFVSVMSDTHGRRMRLEHLRSGQRHFEIVSEGLPREAGDGLRTCRWVQRLLVRVRYEYTHDVDPIDTMVTCDAITIIKALRNSNNWNQGTSGLTAVQFEDEAAVERIGDDDERPEALIISIPFTITYRDC